MKEKRKCSVENCNKPYYAKGYCRNHYILFKRKGKPEYKKRFFQCQFKDCHNKGPYSLGYCGHHYKRYKAGIPLNAGFHETFKGEKNPRWNDGISYYPKHSEMKRVRIKVLKRDNFICQYCGIHTKSIHHVDLSKDNHSEDNLKTCCNKCNLKFAKPHDSKYKRLYGYYGYELKEMGFIKDIILMQKAMKYDEYQPIENLMSFKIHKQHPLAIPRRRP